MNERLNAIVGAKIARFKKKMASVKKTIRSIPNNTVTTVKVVTKTAEKRINLFQNRLARLANSIRAFGTVVANMGQGGLLFASPSLVPILASAVGLLGTLGPLLAVAGSNTVALAAAFGIAGGATVAFGAAAMPTIKSIIDGTAKSTAENNRAKKALQSLKSTWEGVQKAIAPEVANAFADAMIGIQSALKSLNPMFKSVAKTVADLAKDFNKFMKTKTAKQFFGYLNKNAGPILDKIMSGVGGLIEGFMNLTVAFGPLTDFMAQGFKNMGDSFAEFTDRVKNSKGLQTFISYLQTNGPKVWAIIQNITLGLVGMFTAFGPLAADMMTGLQSLTARFKEWGQTLSENQQFQKFIGYIRENAPTVISLIGNITSFLVNLGIAIAPIGAKVLELVNSFFAWTSSMMEAHPLLGKIIALGTMLMGAFMMILPPLVAVRTAFAGFPTIIATAVGKILPLFNIFKLTMLTGLKMLGTRMYLFGTRVMTTAASVLASFGRMIAGAARWAAQKSVYIARVIARYAVLAARSAANAARVAASFTVTMVRAAVTWAARTAAQIAKVIARLAVLSARAAANAARVALSFTVTMVKAAAKAAASMAKSVAKMIAKYALLAAKSMVHAAKVAASWFIAMGPVGWVIGAIVGVAAVVIANWDKIKNWTVKTWNKVWGKIKEIGDKIKGFFEGLDLYQSGKAIIQSAIDGIMNMKDKIVGKVEDIVGAVRDLWPFSPAKEGPLSDIHKMDFAGPIGKSIDKAKRPLTTSMTNLAGVARNAFKPDITMADIGGTATIDTSISGGSKAIEHAFSAEMNDFELPDQREQYAVLNIDGYESKGVLKFVSDGQKRANYRSYKGGRV
ncbi:hypothetical protein [Virgibacillus sp. Bac330]|uniref:hypothetical protein n=1 Tax=Virgibacillus sp. Bac330 TaxID=2419841 RepID=UPI000EF4A90A|nr:hypothetical protein [Virgibacillus sp. Bac330]